MARGHKKERPMDFDLESEVRSIIDEARTDKKRTEGFIRSCDIQQIILKDKHHIASIAEINEVMAKLVTKQHSEPHAVNPMRTKKPRFLKWRKVLA